MNELVPILLIALISLATGFFLGLIVSGLKAEKGNSRTPEAAHQLQESLGGQQSAPRNHGAIQPLASAITNPAPQVTSNLPIQAQVERPGLNPAPLLNRTLQPNIQSKPTPPKSIAAQIDEILQLKLASCTLDHLPAERRAIRLLELPGRGMVVMVGMDRYEGVENVPDAEIRSLIRESVEEWEKRLTAG
jgi:hypothetical protein